jgi:hypothetical protein
LNDNQQGIKNGDYVESVYAQIEGKPGKKMTKEYTDPEQALFKKLAEEEKIRGKVDKDGVQWNKVYFGGGLHFQNWLSQVIELRGKENVEIEETDSRGFQCFEESGEKMYRIWIRKNGTNDNT